jgi:hypothetical protein
VPRPAVCVLTCTKRTEEAIPCGSGCADSQGLLARAVALPCIFAAAVVTGLAFRGAATCAKLSMHNKTGCTYGR